MRQYGGKLNRRSSFVASRQRTPVLVCHDLGLGVLLLASLVLNTWLRAMGNIFPLANVRFRLLPACHSVLDFLSRYYICISAVYKLIPNVRLNWSDVAVGG